MHEDHEVSRRARRKDTVSPDDLGNLLQWHWKYGTSTFANERQRAQTLVGIESDSKTQTIRPRTICYGDIDLFLLRNPDNPERGILMAEVDFRNLKGRPESASG